MPLVQLMEREIALACLAEYAEDAGRSEGRLVLVAGEPGVGKTALLERFEQENGDATWAWGACDGLFTPRPLGPLSTSPINSEDPCWLPVTATRRASSCSAPFCASSPRRIAPASSSWRTCTGRTRRPLTC
jgi:predicted ATPase